MTHDHGLLVMRQVPETSRISALQCAIKLGVPYEEGLNKNRYIARLVAISR